MKKTFLAFSSLALLSPCVVLATFIGSPSSSAGIVERQIQKEYEAKEIQPDKPVPSIELDIPEEQLDFPDSQTVYIRTVHFNGNTVFSSEELQEMLCNDVQCDLHMSDIKALCAKIQARYVNKGYFLTRVYPPAQDIKDGVLVIDVLEGNLGEISVIGNDHYKESFVLGYFSRLQGKPVNYNDFIRALLLVNENMDLNVGALFKKGQRVGTTDLIVRVEDKLPLHLHFDSNNYGSHQNSLVRSGGRFDYGNLITQGDQFGLTGVLGSPMRSLRFADVVYTFPINKIGTHLRLGYLYSDFKVNRLRSLHLKGRSQIATIKATHACYRTKRLNVNAFVGFDIKQVKNIALGVETAFDKLRELRTGVSLDYMDEYKGRNEASFSFTQGIPNFLGGLSSRSHESSRRGGGGLFSIFYLDYLRLQQLPYDSFISLKFDGQASGNKLPLAEQFYIGGIDTVRGYPLATALGDLGYVINLEGRTPIPSLANKRVPFTKQTTWKEVLQLVGFFDTGQVFLNGEEKREDNNVYLLSAGLGVRIYGPWKFNFSYDIGFPITPDHRSSTTISYFKVTWNPI